MWADRAAGESQRHGTFTARGSSRAIATTRSSPTRAGQTRRTAEARPSSPRRDRRTRSVDLKYGVGLNHAPLCPGPGAANGAWLAVQVLDVANQRKLAGRARIGLAEGIVTTKTLRRRLFALAGRLTRLCSCSSRAVCRRGGDLGRQLHRRPRPAAGDPAPDLTPLGLAELLLRLPGASVACSSASRWPPGGRRRRPVKPSRLCDDRS